jgi:hypothetical protein
VRRASRRRITTIALAVALSTTGCSFAFVRPPTPEVVMTDKAACGNRGLALAADALLTSAAVYRATYRSDSYFTIRAGGFPDDVTLRSSWVGRNGATIALAVVPVFLASSIYGLIETTRCTEMRAALRPPSMGAARSRPFTSPSPPAPPAAGAPPAPGPGPAVPAPPAAPQQIDLEAVPP